MYFVFPGCLMSDLTNLSQTLVTAKKDDAAMTLSNCDMMPQTKPQTKPQPTQQAQQQKGTLVLDILYILSTVPMVILTWIQFAFNLLVMASIFYGGYKTICILVA